MTLAIDPHAEPHDEAMRVAVDEDGCLTRIGKDLTGPADGEYVGLFVADGKAASRLRQTLGGFLDVPGMQAAWYEAAIQRLVPTAVTIGTSKVPDSRWVEIDNAADFARAQAISEVY